SRRCCKRSLHKADYGRANVVRRRVAGRDGPCRQQLRLTSVLAIPTFFLKRTFCFFLLLFLPHDESPLYKITHTDVWPCAATTACLVIIGRCSCVPCRGVINASRRLLLSRWQYIQDHQAQTAAQEQRFRHLP